MEKSPFTQAGLDTALATSFWRDRKVLVTGHTGFKGAWLTLWLEEMGAQVTALSLAPESPDGAFSRLSPWRTHSVIADLRDLDAVRDVVKRAAPSVIFHLAAEAIVRRAYAAPLDTFETNVMGTANLLEAVRASSGVDAVLVVTSDKVYENATLEPAREGDPLGHVDPYSSSKACVELLVRAWRSSYLDEDGVRVCTARAGNVIGGGDAAPDRLIPDVLRADLAAKAVVIRNPGAVRPWQHTLDPLHGYLLFAQQMVLHPGDVPSALNFGPDGTTWTVLDVITRLQELLGDGRIEIAGNHGPHEAPALLLDSQLAKDSLGWRPLLSTEDALRWTVDWHHALKEGADLRALTIGQIRAYRERASAHGSSASAISGSD